MLARPSCICNSVRLIQCAGGSGYCVCHRLADLSWGRDVSAACRCAVECAVGRAAVSVPELTKRQSPGRRGDPSTGWGAAGGSGRGLAPSQRRCREGGERLLSASPFAASTSSERLSGLGGKGGGGSFACLPPPPLPRGFGNTTRGRGCRRQFSEGLAGRVGLSVSLLGIHLPACLSGAEPRKLKGSPSCAGVV